ncbi:MAG: response regulator [Elusimicrobia bacterium]|nr:response regulator [Elusimicrobiota bacterium]
MRLKVQTKMTLLISLVISAILAGLVSMRAVQAKRESILFLNEVEVSKRYFEQILKQNSASLTAFVNDYSFWDDMARFLKTRDAEWAADNIVTGLSTFKANAAWVYKPDYTLVYSTSNLSADGFTKLPVPKEAQSLLFRKTRQCLFFAMTPHGLMLISGMTIHPTADSERKTPPLGYFFSGRLWSKEFVSQLSRLTESELSLGPIQPEDTPEKRTNMISFGRPLTGWNGRPVTYIHARREHPIFGMLDRAARRQFALYFISSFALLALFYFFFVRWVSRPLGAISRSLDAESTAPVLALSRDMTEFGHIAQLISRFFSQREELVNEIGERKRAEQELRKLWRAVEQSPTTVVITDTRGVIEYVNPAFTRVTGYGMKEAIGQTPRILKSDAHPPGFYQAMWATLTEGGVWHGEVCNRKKSGEVYWEYTEIAPVRNAQGNVTHYVAIKEDVTERKRAAEELRQAKEAADAANRAKSLFLANMSHEIRTPMNAILGFSQLMQRDPSLTPPQRQHLTAINRSGEHLMELISDILEMSKIEAGRVTLNPAPFDLHGLLRDLEMMFRLRAEAKRLRFSVERIGQVPRHVVGDENKLRQVFINLLGNAFKFTEQGGVTLRVWPEADGGRGLRLWADVEDTGLGIAPEEMGRLFHYFEQAQAGRKVAAGTGLGLAISREFARMMGGDITASSREGQGSVFRFHATLQEADAPAEAGKMPVRRVRRLRPGQAHYRVLVVEDEEDNGRVLARFLGQVGFDVRKAANGKEALEEIEKWSPQLVLMDLAMPVMSGYDAIRRIRAEGKRVKILAITARAFDESRRDAFEAGADDFITKPFREEELYEMVQRLLGVEYDYAESAAPGSLPEKREEVTPEDAASLPAALAAEILEATVKGDFDRVMDRIQQVEAGDARLAAGLRDLAEQFDFQRLIELLSKEKSPC